MKKLLILILILLVACEVKQKQSVFLENKAVNLVDDNPCKPRLLYQSEALVDSTQARALFLAMLQNEKISIDLRTECVNAVQIFKDNSYEIPPFSRGLGIFALTNMTKCGHIYAKTNGEFYLSKKC